MIGAKSQKSIAGVAAFDQKKPFDAFVMGLNEPVQELVIHFSRLFQGTVSIRIVADGAQSRCVAEVIAEGGDLSARIGNVKGDCLPAALDNGLEHGFSLFPYNLQTLSNSPQKGPHPPSESPGEDGCSLILSQGKPSGFSLRQQNSL